MSARWTGFGQALVLAAALASSARADDETRPLAADVDFSKPPQQVEGYNKARITCDSEVRPQGRVFSVHGRAYYPDGVTFAVTLRYWKQVRPFVRARAVVRDRAFSVELGPFPRTIPGGEVVAEAWFDLAQQAPATRKTMTDEKYFSCTPPCRWDRSSVTRVSVAMGGAEAQAADELLEKEQLRRAVDAIVAAFRVEEAACFAARQGQGTVEQAGAALEQLKADLAAASAQLATWGSGRQLLLFPQAMSQVDALGSTALLVGQLHAAVAGVPVGGMVGGQAGFERLAGTLPDLQAAVDTLRGFLAETGSLDREWQKLNDEARARWTDAQQGAAPTGNR